MFDACIGISAPPWPGLTCQLSHENLFPFQIGTYNELVANQGAFAEFLNTYKNGNGDGKGSAGAAGKHATNAKGNALSKSYPG